jgi:hypothetical protein
MTSKVRKIPLTAVLTISALVAACGSGPNGAATERGGKANPDSPYPDYTVT